MSNTVREFSALLKAEAFIPQFARKLILCWAEEATWNKDHEHRYKTRRFPSSYRHNTAKIWYRTRWWWSSWNNILILQWTSFPDLSVWRGDTGDFIPSEKEVSIPIPCLSSFLTLSSTCTRVQVSRSNLENIDTGQEQLKPANKFNEMQTFAGCGMDCAKRIELIPLPSCKERIKKAYCKTSPLEMWWPLCSEKR